MFRRAAATVGRVVAGVGAVQLGAAAVALTDKELSKKPDWYQNAVRSLEDSLKKLGKYGYIESPAVLAEVEEPLMKVADFHNVDIQWRIARLLVEKAALSKCPKEKAHLLHEAMEHAKKALALEGPSGVAGAHKWYAITRCKLDKVEKKADHSDDILKHFEKAASIDDKDPYTFYLLAYTQYKKKDYKAALANFQKAEKIKPGFSSANLYYLGLSQKAVGNKDEAIKTLKQVLETHAKYSHDGRARSQAKLALAGLGLKPEEYEVKDL